MNEAAVKNQLITLSSAISSLPSSGKGKSKKNALKGIYLNEPLGEKSTLDQVLETLSLQVKYMVFDLEATRRENRYLRQMLEARPPKDRERGRDDEGPSSF